MENVNQSVMKYRSKMNGIVATEAALRFFSVLGLLLISVVAVCGAEPYAEPRDTSTIVDNRWTDAVEGLRFGWASKDVHYRQMEYPGQIALPSDTTVAAWRGERVGMEALVISTVSTGALRVRLSGLRHAGKEVAAPGSSAGFMRYVLTTAYNTCGYPSADLPTYTVADMIDREDAEVVMEANSVRPVWCSVEVPRDVAPGDYEAVLTLSTVSGTRLGDITLHIMVADRTMPTPHDYAFYLDMWQQPYAISRYYGVEPWSEEHLKLLAPYADMLGRAGQKTVSTILFYEPWGEQSNDKFEPMVATMRTRDGKWKYDYTIFDRYVEFMANHGVDANISCFTMIPWDMQFRYYDEAKGDYSFLKTTSDSPEYAELWTAFLQSMARHLKEKGWYEKTMVVMDERGLPDMLNARRVAQKAVPGIKMSLAGNYHEELVDSLESYTVIKGDWFPSDVLKRRRDNGYISLLYTCCATPAPNIFSNSEPADAAYLPVYSTATGFDGYLHWSFTNWTDNPLTDTRFHMFAPGDTYFVYPDGRSSIRYERLLEGVQMSEKLRILRAELEAARDSEGLMILENALLPVRTGAMTTYYPTSAVVNNLKAEIDRLSRR